MKKSIQILTTAIILSSIFSCKDDNPKPQDQPKNESELITSVVVKLTDSSTGENKYFKFSDPDGEGGNGPTINDSIKLKNNKTYLCDLLFLDESGTKSDTINEEILEEKNDHLIVYSYIFSALNLKINDKDGNNLPLGLNSTWKTLGPENFKLKIALKHQPDVKDGSPEKGETDVEVEFNCKIE